MKLNLKLKGIALYFMSYNVFRVKIVKLDRLYSYINAQIQNHVLGRLACFDYVDDVTKVWIIVFNVSSAFLIFA